MMDECDYCGMEFKDGQEINEWDYDMGTLKFCNEDCAIGWFRENLSYLTYRK